LGLCYIPAITIIGVYFDKHRAIAFGIASAGCGVGTFLSPVILHYCNEHFGWRGAVLIIGGIQLNHVVCAALYRPLHHTSTDTTKTEHCNGSLHSIKDAMQDEDTDTHIKQCYGNCKCNHWKIFDILKDVPFLLLCFNQFSITIGYVATLVHLAAFAATRGVSSINQSRLYAVFGVVTIFAKIILGALAMIKQIGPKSLYILCFLLAGVIVLCIPLCHRFAELVCVAVLLAFTMSVYGALTPSVAANMVDVSTLPTAYGIMIVFDAVGALIGPPIAG
jgi:MFS family permease